MKDPLLLKTSAQVMCVANLGCGLVNGSRGVVVGFLDARWVREPQVLAWAGWCASARDGCVPAQAAALTSSPLIVSALVCAWRVQGPAGAPAAAAGQAATGAAQAAQLAPGVSFRRGDAPARASRGGSSLCGGGERRCCAGWQHRPRRRAAAWLRRAGGRRGARGQAAADGCPGAAALGSCRHCGGACSGTGRRAGARRARDRQHQSATAAQLW